MTTERNVLPETIAPMLAMPGGAFDSDDHLFEIKWDGTRAMAYVEDPKPRLMNRRDRNISDRYPDLIAALAAAPKGTVLDGEIIVFKDGKSDFQSLQKREQARTPFKITQAAKSLPATFVAFDQLYDQFVSVMDEPLETRRDMARQTVAKIGSPRVIMSEGVVGDGLAYFKHAEELGLEGIIAKRLDSRYQPGKRTDAWTKIKRSQTVLCAVIGYLEDEMGLLRSMILASEEEGKLRYVGKVGSGLDGVMRGRLIKLLLARRRSTPVVPVAGIAGKGKWVEPGLYCTVRCMERTRDGHLRAPVFVELHDDSSEHNSQ